MEGTRPAARLFKILGKDRSIEIENITSKDGKLASSTEEALGYLLDTHFPGNTTLMAAKQRDRNHQASNEDWWVAKKIVTTERVRWAIHLFAPFKSPAPSN